MQAVSALWLERAERAPQGTWGESVTYDGEVVATGAGDLLPIQPLPVAWHTDAIIWARAGGLDETW